MRKTSTLRWLTCAGLGLAGLVAMVVLPTGPAVAADDGPTISYGGALRYNIFVKTWDETNKDKDGDIALDTFRLEADGSYKDLTISAEYRFYSGYHMLHHGYVGWQATDRTNIQFGVHQVPFGIQPYSSHNWFFDVNYYVGLEDDYDLGVKSITEGDNWTFKFAFYKNDEGNYTGSSLDSARYSYDLVNASLPIPGDDSFITRRNEEINQFNARYAYTFQHSEGNSTEVGFSAELGETYNTGIALDGDRTGNHSAFAAHMVGNYGKWNVHLAAMTYEWDVELPADDPVGGDVVAFGAYDFPYWIAAEGDIFLVNVAYNSGLSWGPFESLTFYNNYSTLQKSVSGWEDTQQNVLGMAAAAGPLYCYFDIAAGKNHPWLGEFPSTWYFGLGPGDPNADWEVRFNINVGYYF